MQTNVIPDEATEAGAGTVTAAGLMTVVDIQAVLPQAASASRSSKATDFRPWVAGAWVARAAAAVQARGTLLVARNSAAARRWATLAGACRAAILPGGETQLKGHT